MHQTHSALSSVSNLNSFPSPNYIKAESVPRSLHILVLLFVTLWSENSLICVWYRSKYFTFISVADSIFACARQKIEKYLRNEFPFFASDKFFKRIGETKISQTHQQYEQKSLLNFGNVNKYFLLLCLCLCTASSSLLQSKF